MAMSFEKDVYRTCLLGNRYREAGSGSDRDGYSPCFLANAAWQWRYAKRATLRQPVSHARHSLYSQREISPWQVRVASPFRPYTPSLPPGVLAYQGWWLPSFPNFASGHRDL